MASPFHARRDWQSLAEERIRDAQAAGQFDNLPGFGKPISGLDEPHDELWWVKQKLKREGLSVLPPALQIKLDVEQTLARIPSLSSAAAVRAEVNALNERIRKVSLGAAWGPSIDVMPLEINDVLEAWRQTQSLKE
jgi:hypothetical protein